ncbi:deoxynucleoside kinase [Bacteroidales bacterium OttesenSCG-928-B11]|nr:deoxynucleoside kinase [Bacteroidales bacterium OttesenSCG-928-C03]MDL2311803.1 deoxynucleoside kinase [Bacteroidales bacterium OttesenSCG-928-B11]MDL2326192.1 deoxynucleoside kinase [Bacteroidales bacterium OttesenSCG-928-A14]
MYNINYKYIAIEGCIGAGKTELAQLLHQDLGGEIVLEHFSENKFLPLFYQSPENYAFHLELQFLIDRYEQILSFQKQIKKGNQFVISDYFFDKSFIFSDNNLKDDELELYHRLFHFLHNTLQKPDLVVYLYKSAEHLLRNIRKRGRPYEQSIQQHYLEEIQTKYLDYFNETAMHPILIINTEELDFVENKTDYNYIKSLLSNEYGKEKHLLNF